MRISYLEPTGHKSIVFITFRDAKSWYPGIWYLDVVSSDQLLATGCPKIEFTSCIRYSYFVFDSVIKILESYIIKKTDKIVKRKRIVFTH